VIILQRPSFIPCGSITPCTVGHRKVLISDLVLKRELADNISSGTLGGSKTRCGAKEHDPERCFSLLIYPTSNEKCPVKSFKSYFARQPAEMKKTRRHIVLGSDEKSQRNNPV